jgi:hypothetical protein
MTVGTETKSNLVPKFIKASSAELLTEAMLLNNLILKKEIKYQDIQFANGDWFAWFYDEVDLLKRISTAKAK